MTENDSHGGAENGGGKAARIQECDNEFVVPTYSRFDLSFERGEGAYLWDTTGKRYLDFGGGIAVNILGQCHPELTAALTEQAGRLTHTSNLYYHERQGKLAETLTKLIGPGKCFFCNSGAEANEGLFKLARRFGDEEGRFEILTMSRSFHGRTLACMAATGQEKVKKGFGPAVSGFRQVPFNDIDALRQALSPATVAIMIEGVQGEGGVYPADPAYLLELRRFCDENRLLLLMDEVQAGHFRTGQFMSYQRILEETPGGKDFLPDGIAMAKSLGGGFPIGAFWVRQPYADLLGPGTHASTFGGGPLACSVALKILEVIRRDRLDRNARELGCWLQEQLSELIRRYPQRLKMVRGLGLMVGIELTEDWPTERSPAARMVHQLHQEGLLAIPAGPQVVRFLPALNLSKATAEAGLELVDTAMKQLSQ